MKNLKNNISLFMFLFMLSACSTCPVPKNDISGVMKIEYYDGEKGFTTLVSQFTVDASEKKFTAYIQDERGFPVGKLVMRKKKIIEKDLPEDIIDERVFGFWPYIFSDSIAETSGVKLSKGNWCRRDDTVLPREVNVRGSGIDMDIQINYAD